jgi:LEA14-like dessication related protein
MPALIILGAVFLIMNLLKQESVSITPTGVALNLQDGFPKLRVRVRIYNPSKLSLKISQVSGIAVSNGVSIARFSLDRPITLPGESNTQHYFNFGLMSGVITNFDQILPKDRKINITGFAIANGVKVNFTQDVSIA